MKHEIDLGACSLAGGQITDVCPQPFDPLCAVREVSLISSCQVVQHTNVSAALQECVDEMRADETGAAGDQSTGTGKSTAWDIFS